MMPNEYDDTVSQKRAKGKGLEEEAEGMAIRIDHHANCLLWLEIGLCGATFYRPFDG
jgi:hypothetical protein